MSMGVNEATTRLARVVRDHGKCFEDAEAWQVIVDLINEQAKKVEGLKSQNAELVEAIAYLSRRFDEMEEVSISWTPIRVCKPVAGQKVGLLEDCNGFPVYYAGFLDDFGDFVDSKGYALEDVKWWCEWPELP